MSRYDQYGHDANHLYYVYGLAANRVSQHVVDSPQLIVWLQRSFAATFAALGVKLAMTDQ